MKRNIWVLVLSASLLVLAPVALHAQALENPDVLNGYVGPQLIAWSPQEPQPMPEPAPKATPRPTPDPDPQPETPQQDKNTEPVGSNSNPQSQPASTSPDVQTLMGTIVSVQDRCVLKANGDTTYELDNQEKAKPFSGKHVKVVGKVDSATNMVHVESIEPIS